MHALDIKYWGIESLSKIGSILGIPLKTDKFTKDKQVIRYARLLVEMQIDGPFPEYIDFFNEDGILIRQQVTYEWIPKKCAHCTMLGHSEDVCKKKGVIRTEWRQKSQAPTQAIMNPPSDEHPHTTREAQPVDDPTTICEPYKAPTHEVCPGPYMHKSKGTSPKRTTEAPSNPVTTHHNRFEVLLNEPTLEETHESIPTLPTHDKHSQLEC